MSGPGTCDCEYPVRNNGWLVADVLVVDTQRRDASPLEILVPTRVGTSLISASVASAIELNSEHELRAVEVEDERADRMLTSKFESRESTAA
jgi:hypothetical protein